MCSFVNNPAYFIVIDDIYCRYGHAPAQAIAANISSVHKRHAAWVQHDRAAP